MRSGNVNVGNGRMRNAGLNSYNWSTVASSKHDSGETYPSAYILNFNVAGVVPSNGPNSRWYGLPLRRLAKRVSSGHFLKIVHGFFYITGVT